MNHKINCGGPLSQNVDNLYSTNIERQFRARKEMQRHQTVDNHMLRLFKYIKITHLSSNTQIDPFRYINPCTDSHHGKITNSGDI